MQTLIKQLKNELGLKTDRVDLNRVKIGDCFVTYGKYKKHKLDFASLSVLEIDLKLFVLELVKTSSCFSSTVSLDLGKKAFGSEIEYLKLHTKTEFSSLGQSFFKAVVFSDPRLDIEGYYFSNFVWIVVTKVNQSGKINREFYLAKI